MLKGEGGDEKSGEEKRGWVRKKKGRRVRVKKGLGKKGGGGKKKNKLNEKMGGGGTKKKGKRGKVMGNPRPKDLKVYKNKFNGLEKQHQKLRREERTLRGKSRR